MGLCLGWDGGETASHDTNVHKNLLLLEDIKEGNIEVPVTSYQRSNNFQSCAWKRIFAILIYH